MEVGNRWPLGRRRTARYASAHAVVRLVSLIAFALAVLLASACGGGGGAPGGGSTSTPLAGGPNAVPTPLPTSIIPTGGRIAFVSLRNGQPEIHAIDKNPVWAPLL